MNPRGPTDVVNFALASIIDDPLMITDWQLRVH